MTAITSVEAVIEALSANREPIPTGLLVKAIHTLEGIERRVQSSPDQDEQENLKRFMLLTGAASSEFAEIALSGAFKPSRFIHRFERYYSLPGYLDEKVLTAFFNAADRVAPDISDDDVNSLQLYLSFLYVGFLVIHPFVDRNGRVVRGLLDYHHKRTRSKIKRIWHQQTFRQSAARRDAFITFFRDEAKVPTFDELGLEHPFPITATLEPHLVRLATHTQEWFEAVAEGQPVSTASVSRIGGLLTE